MRPHTSAKSDHERKETFGYSNIFTSLSLFKARCMSEKEILQLDKASQKLTKISGQILPFVSINV